MKERKIKASFRKEEISVLRKKERKKERKLNQRERKDNKKRECRERKKKCKIFVKKRVHEYINIDK